MDMKKIVAVIIAGTVCALIFGALLPVWADTTASEDTFTNKGYYDMTYTETDSLVFEWDHTTPKQVVINNEIVTLPDADATPKTLLCGDNWLVRYAYSNTNGTFVQFYGSSGSNVSASEGETTDITITCSSGSVSVVNTADTPATFSTTYTHLYIVTDSGNLVMKEANTPAYLNGDSEIVAMGLSRVGTVSNVGIMITGSLDDGFTWSIFRGSDTTFSNQNAVYSEASNYEDLYILDKLTATATNPTGSSDLTYSYFIVPAEVTAERTVHMSGALATLVNIIPLLIAFGLITGIAGVVIYKRM